MNQRRWKRLNLQTVFAHLGAILHRMPCMLKVYKKLHWAGIVVLLTEIFLTEAHRNKQQNNGKGFQRS